VTLEIPYGEIYGLLGANGAGKTTTIRMLCGLLEATSGSMRLAGEQGNLRSESIRQQIGYMSQKFSLYNDMTIRENLSFFAGVYGVPESERDEKIRWVLSFSGLEGKEDQITGSLPGGWKQRVAFGAAIMHEPSVLFLDEPTSGVDPLARRAFWVMINRLADAGTAILVTTHYSKNRNNAIAWDSWPAENWWHKELRAASRARKPAIYLNSSSTSRNAPPMC